LSKGRPASGERDEGGEVASYQSFFLCTRPAFDLSLCEEGFANRGEVLYVDELDGLSFGGVVAAEAVLVGLEADFEVDGGAGVVGAIGAAEDVEVAAHLGGAVVGGCFDRLSMPD